MDLVALVGADTEISRLAGQAFDAAAQKPRRGEWGDLANHLTDEVMKRVVPQGTYREIPDILAEWYSGLCTGLSLPVPADDEQDAAIAELVQRCKTIPATASTLG